MRKLHLVGFTTDRQGLIFSGRKGSKTGGFLVPLEKKLLDTIAEAQQGNGGAGRPLADAEAPSGDKPAGRVESALTPREMQARLRAGRSIEEVAAEANVDTEWVERFAVPILAEQAKVVELARGLVYSKPRLGESTQPLGESVALNLAERGVYLPPDVFDGGWSAFQLHDSVWMVRFRYESRNRQHEAGWELDVASGRITARDRLASELGFAENGRRRRAARGASADEAGDEPASDAAGTRGRIRPPAVEPVAAKGVRAPGGRRSDARRATPPPPAGGSTRAAKAARGASSTGRAPGGKPAGRKAAKVSPQRRKRSPGPNGEAAEPGTPAADAPIEATTAPTTAGVRQAVARVTAARLADARANGPRLTLQNVDGSRRTGGGSAIRRTPAPPSTSEASRPRPTRNRQAPATPQPSPPVEQSPTPPSPPAPPAPPPAPPAPVGGAAPVTAATDPPRPRAERAPKQGQRTRPDDGSAARPRDRPAARPSGPAVRTIPANPAPAAPQPAAHHSENQHDDDDWLGLTEDLDEPAPSTTFAPRPLPAAEPRRQRGGPDRPPAAQRRPTISAGRVGGEASFPSPQRPAPPPKVGAPPLKPLSERSRRRLRLGRRRDS